MGGTVHSLDLHFHIQQLQKTQDTRQTSVNHESPAPSPDGFRRTLETQSINLRCHRIDSATRLLWWILQQYFRQSRDIEEIHPRIARCIREGVPRARWLRHRWNEVRAEDESVALCIASCQAARNGRVASRAFLCVGGRTEILGKARFLVTESHAASE